MYLGEKHIETKKQLDYLFVSSHVTGWAAPKTYEGASILNNSDHRILHGRFSISKDMFIRFGNPCSLRGWELWDDAATASFKSRSLELLACDDLGVFNSKLMDIARASHFTTTTERLWQCKNLENRAVKHARRMINACDARVCDEGVAFKSPVNQILAKQ